MTMKSKLLLSSFSKINPRLIEPFCGKCIAVTGASGYIGSLLCRYIIFCNEIYNSRINLVAFGRNRKKVDEILQNYGQYNFEYIDFEKDSLCKVKGIDYIVHAASITKSKTMIEKPTLVLNTAINGCRTMLELAKLNNAKLLNISSMEAYGDLQLGEIAQEDKLGYIDILSPRSCYPESKRFCECLCAAYSSEYSIPTISARLAQTFGVGVLKEENRAFAQFVKSAIKGEDIILNTLGKSEANYVNSIDCLEALLLLLNKGESRTIYNVVDPKSHRTILSMAELVSKTISNGVSRVVISYDKSNKAGYASDVHLRMSNDRIKKLGWCPKKDLVQSILQLRDYLIEQSFE